MRVESTGKSPTPDEVKEARLAAGQTQLEACATVHLKETSRWSEYEKNSRTMDAARWELYLIKTNQHPEYVLRKTAGRKTNQERLARAALHA